MKDISGAIEEDNRLIDNHILIEIHNSIHFVLIGLAADIILIVREERK